MHGKLSDSLSVRGDIDAMVYHQTYIDLPIRMAYFTEAICPSTWIYFRAVAKSDFLKLNFAMATVKAPKFKAKSASSP